MRSPNFFAAVVILMGLFCVWQAATNRGNDVRARTYPAAEPNANGSVQPFPPTPSASMAGPTLAESRMTWRKEPQRLKPGAPNVLIMLIDDVGFGIPDTFGGEVHTPTLSKLRDSGIC